MRPKDNHDILAKLIIIGDSGVGKTNLILSFVGQKFKDNYVATIGVDFKAKTMQSDGKKIKLQIWDTAGQERYRTITETYYKGASGIVLAYSMIDRQSFDNLNNWMFQINQKAPPGVPKIIVANKCDMAEKARAVTVREGELMAEKFSSGGCKILFREVSAKSGEGVQQVFEDMCEMVRIQFQKQNAIKPTIKIIESRHADEEQKKCAC